MLYEMLYEAWQSRESEVEERGKGTASFDRNPFQPDVKPTTGAAPAAGCSTASTGMWC
jgi:hypothetical protein